MARHVVVPEEGRFAELADMFKEFIIQEDPRANLLLVELPGVVVLVETDPEHPHS